MLTVWGRANSVNVQKVMWTVGELDIAHVRIDAGGSFGGLDSSEFLARNPSGKIPVIEDDGFVLWESNAIVRYLGAKYGAGSFWPETPEARAETDKWVEWTANGLYPDFITVFWELHRVSESERNMDLVESALTRLNKSFQLAEQILDGKRFVAGDTLTFGDISFGTNLYRYFNMEIARPSLPGIEAYYASLKERPAYQVHVMVPF